ncbi:hypothetical protein F0U44_06970 [Nocardioides humilatus]|uniref:Uncharacterized protein n=1 Tax=Nocardioides humilatus TaxID=2607660 RepID=A0A5B1LHH0_9ACTN|nr:hypothetical protein [Nocardioides humilatus]KAA1420165.1 hypothetical protein F0U44_06970 [Nocardioides humilatus]
MTSGVRWLVPLVALLATGCSDPAKPVFPQDPPTQTLATDYDAGLEPSAAVLALVPQAATTLEVTDFDELRLTLGFGALDRSSPEADRAAFWRAVTTAATLSDGMLRPFADQLAAYDFGEDDVAWEASYGDGADGWVIALHDDVPLAQVQKAIDDGVGPLAGAELDTDSYLLTSTTSPDGEESWGALPEVVQLVGQSANATYVDRACLDFDTVFGAGMEAQLAAGPRLAFDALDPLTGFSVALGADLATVRLGEARSDAFDRLRIADVMPAIKPEFGAGYARGVADPSTGRIGYDIQGARAAVELIEDRHLPFAVCGD